MGFTSITSAALSELYAKYYKSFFSDLLCQAEPQLTNELLEQEGLEWFSYFLLNADPTFVTSKNVMGTYSKWCLGVLQTESFQDVGSSGALVVLLNSLADKLYEALTQYMGIQKLLKGPYEKYRSITAFKTLPDLQRFLEEFSSQDMSDIAKESSDIIYEDSSWLIVSPKSYYAAQYFGKQTAWCTSDPKSSNHYNRYTKDGQTLIMFLSLSGKECSYQLAWPRREFRDETDKEADAETFFLDVLPEAAADAVCKYLRVSINMLYSSRRRIFQGQPSEITLTSGEGLERLLILSSRFKGIEDTLASYNGRQLHWTAPRLAVLSDKPDQLAASLQADDKLKADCLESFGRFLEKYFHVLRGSSQDLFAKLGLHYGSKTSIEAVVQGIKDAMDLNGFVPVGYHLGLPSTVTVAGTKVESPGSFYFHAVFAADTTWATNFQARISLHVSKAQARAKEGYESSDYELGDFFELQLGDGYENKFVTDLGIDLDSFKSWLSIKKDAYLKWHYGKTSSKGRVDEVAIEYRKLLSRLAKDQERVTILQGDAISRLALGLLASDAHRGRGASAVKILDEGRGAFKRGPAVLRTLEGFSDELIAGLSTGKAEALFGLSAVLTEEGTSLGLYSDIFASYEAQLRESLEHMDFLAEDYALDGVYLGEAVDAFLDMFQFAGNLLPHLADLSSGMGYAVEAAAHGSWDLLVRLGPSQLYWSSRIMAPVDGDLTSADFMDDQWGRFSSASKDLLDSFLKALKSSKCA